MILAGLQILLALVATPTIADLNRAVSDSTSSVTNFRFTGQILDMTPNTFYLSDTSGCIRVRHALGPTASFVRGDILEVTAKRSETGLPLAYATGRRVGHGPLPEPRDVSGGDVAQGRCLNRFIRVSGVVMGTLQDEIDSRYNWTILRTPTGPVAFATGRDAYSPARLKSLIDAEVVIEGLCVRFSTWRIRLGARIDPLGKDPIRIREAPPTDLDRIAPLSAAPTLHRQRVSGRVVAVCRTHFFLQTGDETILRVQPSERLATLTAGQRVTVAGFVEHDLLQNVELDEALVRCDDPTIPESPAPTPITLADLFKQEGSGITVNHLYNQSIISIEGTLATHPDQKPEDAGLWILSDGTRSITIDLSGLNATPQSGLLPGARVQVSGFCRGTFEHAHTTIGFPSFTGFTVIPRSPADIRVLARPPWWTPGRLAVVIGVLAAFLIATLVWNRTLRIVSERRGRALAWEQTCHAKSELKVEERTRLAVELHDSISQTLTGVALQIETALSLADVSFGPAEKLLLTARQMLASCRQELRCCLWDLRSRTFEERDIAEAIRRTIEPHTADTRVAIRFNVARAQLSEASVHAILKIVRELVVNAIRHGHAQTIQIAGEYRDRAVNFSVRDDGCGFDPATAADARQGHFGLQGIRERALARQGTVRVISAPGAGTKVIVTLKDILT